jgi:hypothetical protein
MYSSIADDVRMIQSSLKKLFDSKGTFGPTGPTGPSGSMPEASCIEFEARTYSNSRQMKLWIRDDRTSIHIDDSAGRTITIEQAEVVRLIKALNEAFVLDMMGNA